MSVELSRTEQARMAGALRHALEASGPVAFFETHLSFVLVAGGFAYKLKKAVDLGFADFTTLAKRRFYCDEELRLNRRLAPALYLGTLPVTGTIDAPRLGGDGPVLDHAVRMLAFDPEQQWDRLAGRNAITATMIDALADTLAAFHLQLRAATGTPAAPPARAPAPGGAPPPADPHAMRFGSAAHVHAIAQENFTTLRRLLRDADDQARLERLATREADRHAAMAAQIDARAAAGFVVECHGDLHLGNIAQIDGQPTVFDAIEFNESFRWTDVICEIAFLAMDLRHRGLDGLAARLLNAWLDTTGDHAGLRLLSYYLAYRAMVRAKVAAIRAAQLREASSGAAAGQWAATGARTSAADDAIRADTQCRDYLALAERIATPAPACLVLMHGLSGSGKTLASGLLAEAIGAVRLRSDVERKRLHGLRADDHSAANTAMYGAAADEATYDRLAELVREVTGAGFTVIVDATFLARTRRARFVRLARDLGAPAAIVDLRASPHTLRARVAERSAHGEDPSDADLAVLESQFARDDVVLPNEADQVLRVDSDRRIDAAVMQRVAAALAGSGQ